MFDCVTKVFVIFRVHDFFIVVVAFGGPCFDILTKVLSSSYNVIVASMNQEKIVSEVHNVSVVLWIDKRMWCTLQILTFVDLNL
jgi:hypothetical protein